MRRKVIGDGFRLISEDAAKELLADLHDPLFRIATASWSRLQGKGLGLVQRPSRKYLTVAMHELLEEEARTQLDARPGISFLEGRRFLVNVGNRALLQFKKVDHDLLSSNYPTPSALAFDRQQQLPGVPWVPRITIGYQPDETWTRMICIAVLLRRGDNVVWNYELGEADAVTQLPAMRSPLPSKVVVKPKAQTVMKFAVPPKKG